MRRAALAIVLGFFLCAPCVVRAQGEFALELQEIKGKAPPGVAEVEKTVSPLPGKPYKVKALPAGLSRHVSYYGVHLAGKPIVMLLDMTEAPKLYVDTNADFDLSNDKPAEGTTEKEQPIPGDANMKTYDFGAFRVEGGEGRAPVMVRAKVAIWGKEGNNYLSLYPAAIRSGQVRLGDKSYTVQLVDADFDGRYDGMASLSTSRDKWDLIAVDLGSQGTAAAQTAPSEEAQPLSKLMRLGGNYYGVQVAADGSTMRLEEAHTALATLDVGQPGVKLTVMSDSGFYSLSGEGKWQLPVGHYQTQRVTLSKTDDKGDVWTLSGSASTGKLKAFDIAEGQTLATKAGPPLVVRTSADNMGARAVSIGVDVTGQAGEKYTPGVAKNGAAEPPPTLRILDESGKVLGAGSFQYG
jgi:hypothetical protein